MYMDFMKIGKLALNNKQQRRWQWWLRWWQPRQYLFSSASGIKITIKTQRNQWSV